VARFFSCDFASNRPSPRIIPFLDRDLQSHLHFYDAPTDLLMCLLSCPEFCSELTSRAPTTRSAKTDFCVYLSEPDACQSCCVCGMEWLFLIFFTSPKSGLLFHRKPGWVGNPFSANQARGERGQIKYTKPCCCDMLILHRCNQGASRLTRNLMSS